jgi:hypothetical protein
MQPRVCFASSGYICPPTSVPELMGKIANNTMKKTTAFTKRSKSVST